MNRRSIFTLSAITVLGLAMLPTGAVSQQKTLKEQLVGVWTLVSNDTTPTSGTKRQDFGANPKGSLILDAGGRYALVQGRPDRPKFKDAGNLRLGATAEEFAAAARPFAANFGTWSVNEADKTLIRKYELALIPNNDALESKVSVSLSGDELKLVGTGANGDRADTVYRRAK
jgi:Lipocalin-like domain